MKDAPTPVRRYNVEFPSRLPTYDGPPLFLLACAPKSGSTYAAAILCSYLGTGKFFAGKVPNRAVQDLDAVWIEDEVAAGRTVIHQHVPWHTTTQAYIDHYRMRPVVLVRDLADSVASIRDHLRAVGIGSWPGAHFDRTMLARNDAELEEAIASLIMPWYFTFLAGWRESGYPILTYDQLNSDPASLLTAFGIEVDQARLDAALTEVSASPTRRNVGTSGRGDRISPEARRHLTRLSAHYAHIDHTPIMQWPYAL